MSEHPIVGLVLSNGINVIGQLVSEEQGHYLLNKPFMISALSLPTQVPGPTGQPEITNLDITATRPPAMFPCPADTIYRYNKQLVVLCLRDNKDVIAHYENHLNNERFKKFMP